MKDFLSFETIGFSKKKKIETPPKSHRNPQCDTLWRAMQSFAPLDPSQKKSPKDNTEVMPWVTLFKRYTATSRLSLQITNARA